MASARAYAPRRLAWPVYVAGDAADPDGSIPRTPAAAACWASCRHEMLADWYSRASIYALPARYEPFGLSVLEAALSGCALVLGDIAEPAGNLGRCGRSSCAPDDPDALRDALGELIASLRIAKIWPSRAPRAPARFHARAHGAAICGPLQRV